MSTSIQILTRAPDGTNSESGASKGNLSNHATIKFRASTQEYRLVTLKHEPMALVSAAIAYFSRPISAMLPKQRTGLHNLRQAIEGWETASKNKSQVPSKKYMTKMLHDISSVFFLDKVRTVKFEWNTDVELLGYHDPREGFQDRESYRKYATIGVNPRHHRDPDRSMKSLELASTNAPTHFYQSFSVVISVPIQVAWRTRAESRESRMRMRLVTWVMVVLGSF